MEFSRAIAQRINELLAEQQITAYRLSFLSAVPTSTVSNILRCTGKACNADTLLNICRGFNIPLSEFFASDLFDFENIPDD